ncbi:MAG: hypothetical protein SPG61_03955, partial [Arcanobacterium sp.]|nr:hypothetical protein [Arcanobacterium sp.]
GIALAFGHQIIGAGPFISGFARIWWIALYVIVLFNILAWRVFLPWIQNRQFSLIVDAVVRETADTVSIWLKGRNLELLQARSGQFINLRFKHPGLLWEAHPFSLSAPVQKNHLRITVKNLGDASAKMQELQPGTRVFIEGPYGISTAAAQRHQQALLIAGGIGIAPIRALAESLSNNQQIKVDLVVRARSWEQLALRNELELLNQRENVKVYYLLGSRQEYPIDENLFSHFLPDPTQVDVYACGSEDLLADVRKTASDFGVPETNLHIDSFEM